MVRIRYRQPLQNATLHKAESGLYIEFDVPQKAITEGQFAAWYLDDELVGSGVIGQKE
jgi:tRNA-specific 2-thiouridylase